MYIGLLTDPKSNINVSYSYYKRGTDKIYNPDFKKEPENKPAYDLTGSLITDYVSFDGVALSYGSIDIHIILSRTCFIDTIEFCQYDNSVIGEVTILTRNSDNYTSVGLYHAESGKLITNTEISVPIGVYTDMLILRLKGESIPISIGKLKIWGMSDTETVVYPLPKSIEYKDGYLTDKSQVFSVTDDSMPYEAYTISVNCDKATIRGGSRRALLYAGERIKQLTTDKGIRCAEISDEPFMGIRGVHLALPARDEIPFLKRLIRHVLMPLGYNTVFLQLSGAMEYKKHPKINEMWSFICRQYDEGKVSQIPAHYGFIGKDILSHDEIKDLCSYMREYGFEIVPEIQCFGHSQYINMAYPELAEKNPPSEDTLDMYIEDIIPEDAYAHTMCPNHPDYYKIIFDIMDEAIEVVNPEKYVHIGHDEIYTIAGNCDRCRGMAQDEIYLKEVSTLNEHIRNKGLTTMMWSDMIQEQKYPSSKAISKIPKDIICLSFTWYFHLDEDIENMLYDNGFKVMIGNMYSSHFPRFNQRKIHPNLIGAEVSTWVPCREFNYAYVGKLFDIIYTANMMWNSEYHENMCLSYTELSQMFVFGIKPMISEHYMNTNAKKIDFKSDCKSVPYDIRNTYTKAASLSSGDVLSIPSGGFLSKISFLGATDRAGNRGMWYQTEDIGSYIIRYKDGSTFEDSIHYGANIAEYKRRYGLPLKSALYRHEGYFATVLSEPVAGKTISGEDYTLYNYTIVNPCPEKEITEICVKNTADNDIKILIFDIRYE